MDIQSDDGPPPRRPIPRTRREGPVIEAERTTRDNSGRAWGFAAFGALAGAALALAGAYLMVPAPDLAALSARLDALEAAAVSAADQRRALADRLVAAEAALRRRAEAVAAAPLTAEARPLAVLSLRQRFDSGAPYGAELAAVERFDPDPQALADLRRFAASGAPTRAALLHEARNLLPPPESESRFWGLVKTRKLGISHGAEAEDAVAREDLPAALAAFRAMPPQPQREAWMRAAEAWTKADKAAEALLLEAVAAPGR